MPVGKLTFDAAGFRASTISGLASNIGHTQEVVLMRIVTVVAIISLLSANTVFAQTTTPPANPAAANKTTPKAKPPEKPRTAESIECSKQADAKGLHGKERQTFRSKCMKDLKKKT
jgi:psiF repeat-containing protein